MKTHRFSRWMLTAAVALVAGLGLYWAVGPGGTGGDVRTAERGADATPVRGGSAASAATSAATSAAKTPGPGAQPLTSAQTAALGKGCERLEDVALSYEAAVSSTVDIESGRLGLPQGVVPKGLQREGRFALDIQAMTPERDGTVALVALRDLRGDAFDVEGLERPFLIRVGYDCQIVGFAHHEETTRAVAKRQQSLLYAFAFRWNTDPDATYHGQNSVGFFAAQSDAVAEGDAFVLSQTVSHYERLWGTEGVGRLFALVPQRSRATVRLTGDGWFETYEAREVLVGEGIRLATAVSAHAIAVRDDALEGADRDTSHYVWRNLLPEETEGRAAREVTAADLRARAAVAPLSVQQSVDAYVARVAAGEGIADTWPPLMHYLEAHPDAAGEVLQKVKAGEIPAEATAGVYVALGRARTEEAKAVLMSVVHDGAAPAFERTRAMFALVDRDDVDESFAQQLAALSGTDTVLERESLLALGALAGLQKNPKITAIAKHVVEASLRTGGPGTALSPAFGALANIGDASMLPHAAKASHSADYTLREAAAISARRLRPEESEALVADWLARERHPDVKRRLYRTTYLQTADTHEAVGVKVAQRAIYDLRSMPDVMTRKSIVRLLGTVADTMPEAREALMTQLPRELEQKEAGIYEVVAQQLAPEDVRAALGL